ncbi:MAG TPA: glycerol-3-phosphate 1-O-acyltransferase PlsY [Anaeromyxobacteraceae bacterium]|nr:glycerol-3-phosphate 1-O-acyltransferase PlsY [Anaeromyxobacteraceae bacterium]
MTAKVLLVCLGYLAGSIPFGVVLGRLVAGVDVRTVGSGNIGASNVARAAGKGTGIVVLLLDALKAVLPMLATRAILAPDPSANTWATLVGLAAFLGHIFPVWLGFKGGKGVATALGVFAVLAPLPTVLAVGAFAVAFALTRVPAVGSLAGTAVCTAGVFAIYGGRSVVAWAALVVAVLVVWRHRSNLARLRKGAENKV